jgi:hypothetical protein
MTERHHLTKHHPSIIRLARPPSFACLPANGRETERRRDRKKERHRDRETQRKRDRETDRQTDRETERKRDREKEAAESARQERQEPSNKSIIRLARRPSASRLPASGREREKERKRERGKRKAAETDKRGSTRQEAPDKESSMGHPTTSDNIRQHPQKTEKT